MPILSDRQLFVVNQDKLFRHVEGVPMGKNCGPQTANIYLFVYEDNYIYTLIDNKDVSNLYRLQCIFRHQDDLISFNDDGFFR